MRRREFNRLLLATGTVPLGWTIPAYAETKPQAVMRFGLVTYLWGKDMDLPTLLSVCVRSGIGGVELRTEHAHRVEPALSSRERADVRKRFADSPVTLVGYGSNAQFHEQDPAQVRHNIELTKQYVQLMHDCGGSGVKVKPNGFVTGVPHGQTIEQIGRSLHEVGEYALGFGQQIRVEVHGSGTSELGVIKAICQAADHANVKVCWNSNAEDLAGDGLQHNFHAVSEYFGDTLHVRELESTEYPYPQLFQLLRAARYPGWVLLEARTDPTDKAAALRHQRELFDNLLKG